MKPSDTAGHQQIVGAAAWQQATVWHLESVMDTSMLRDACGFLCAICSAQHSKTKTAINQAIKFK